MIKTIRAKIVWTFSILVILNLVAGFWSIYNFYAMGTTVATILRENYNSVRAAENMVKALEHQDNALLFMSEGEEEPINGDFAQNKEDFFYWYDQAVRALPLPGQRALLDSIQATYLVYAAVADSMDDRLSQGAVAEAKQYYNGSVRPTSTHLRELCFTLFGINQNAMFDAEAKTHSIANLTAYGTMLASIVSLLLSVVAAAWLLKVVIRPAEELTETVRQVGMGRLDLKTDIVSNDEIGDLSREFNKMTERLRRFEQMNVDKILAEKRKSEAIVESISDGLIVTDAAMAILHVNKTLADLFAFDEHESIGRPVSAMVRDERIVNLIRTASARATENLQQQYLQFERDEKSVFFRPKVTRIFDSAGSFYGVVTLLQDVTQFKELDRLKSDFIATLSHEFKTPLTSMNMSIDLLDQLVLGPLNERQKEIVDSAREDCQRLTKLARELLQLSRLEAGRPEFHNEELDLAAVVEFSLKPLQLQFRDKQVLLTVSVPPELPRFVADEQQISWVITNLVTNALKYTDPGGSVTLRAHEDADGIVFEVEDTGRGIEEQYLGKIFDKFVQVRNGMDNSPGSVGLGLAIAREIVETYGGRIWATSTPGRGSIFSFRLPLHQHHPSQPLPS